MRNIERSLDSASDRTRICRIHPFAAGPTGDPGCETLMAETIVGRPKCIATSTVELIPSTRSRTAQTTAAASIIPR